MISVFGSPVLVYQMGKVGSKSVYNTLKPYDLPGSLHHVHLLSQKKLDRSLDQHLKNNIKPTVQLLQSIAVRSFIDSNPGNKIFIITMVREPISQLVSSFFQNLNNDAADEIRQQPEKKFSELQSIVRHQLEQYDPRTAWNCNWFESEFKPATNIDIYETEFANEDGFVQLERDGISVLCLRLESPAGWDLAIAKFLGLNVDFELKSQNVSNQKYYGTLYTQVKKSLKISEDALKRIYGTKYATHFYTEEMIDSFKQKFGCGLSEAA